MTVKVAYLNGRVPTQDRMTAEVQAIVKAAIAYILASDDPYELYAALEVAVLAYLPPMAVEITEQEEEE